jgi:hypothetical protein
MGMTTWVISTRDSETFFFGRSVMVSSKIKNRLTTFKISSKRAI